jgi:hypothetical protein
MGSLTTVRRSFSLTTAMILENRLLLHIKDCEVAQPALQEALIYPTHYLYGFTRLSLVF